MAVQIGPLILYNEPGASTMAITGTGAGWAFLTDATHLYNGRPADQTAVQWGNTGVQTTAENVKIQRVWVNAIVPSVITVRGLTGIPQGAKATVTGQRVSDGAAFPYALGGNSVNATAHTFADGSIGWVFVLDAALTGIRGYQLQINNDVAGAIFNATPSFTFLIGETMCYVGYQPPQSIQFDWQFDYDGVAPDVVSTNNQPWPQQTLPWDTLDITLCAADYPTTWGTVGAPNAIVYNNLSRTLVQKNACGCIVRTVDSAGALDLWAIYELAIFGIAKKCGKPRPLGGDFYEWAISFKAAAPGT